MELGKKREGEVSSTCFCHLLSSLEWPHVTLGQAQESWEKKIMQGQFVKKMAEEIVKGLHVHYSRSGGWGGVRVARWSLLRSMCLCQRCNTSTSLIVFFRENEPLTRSPLREINMTDDAPFERVWLMGSVPGERIKRIARELVILVYWWIYKPPAGPPAGLAAVVV